MVLEKKFRVVQYNVKVVRIIICIFKRKRLCWFHNDEVAPEIEHQLEMNTGIVSSYCRNSCNTDLA